MASEFTLTYSTMFDPPPELHAQFEDALASVRSFLGAEHPMLIGGRDQRATQRFNVKSPIDTRMLLGRFEAGDATHAAAAIAEATRAFPAGHDSLKGTEWEHAGHPILIPGSNHDTSFILRATPTAAISGYSVNHGAGRRMSRGAARKTLKQVDIDRDYRTAGIVVNLDGNVPIDESGDAYKSSREVVGAVTRAGLATVEHELVPLASIKGNE